jgi:hypothetical protein
MAWWKRKTETMLAGSVLYRGKWPARPTDFAFLTERGLQLEASPRAEDGSWSAKLTHRAWGTAMLRFDPELPAPPRVLIDWDPRLTTAERALAEQGGSTVAVTMQPASGNVLRDRKDLLRFLHAVMGEDGLCVIDHTAQSFWSRDALELELAHDADLDIDALYTTHLITDGSEDGTQAPYWLHSHGLGELGFWDFDILDPSEALNGEARDLVRVLAFASVEGRLSDKGEPFQLVDGVDVVGVEAREFRARGNPKLHRAWRSELDKTHLSRHLVVCEKWASGFFARLLGRDRPRTSGFLGNPLARRFLYQLSTSATELLAERSRRTLGLFDALRSELAVLEHQPLVKLGYPIDGDPSGERREHLWFEVHGMGPEGIDATLMNAPFDIARMHEGQRGLHSPELLSEWAILTPVGRVDPRGTHALRTFRQEREQILEALAMMSAEAAGS